MADRRAANEKPSGASSPNRINRLLLAKIKRDYQALTNLVMIRNDGIDCQQSAGMRAELRAQGIKIEVVRNRISMRAFKEMGVEDAEKLFDGPTAIIEAEDPVVAAKVAAEFCKKFDRKLVIVGGLVEGKVQDREAVLSLSRAKSRPELLSEVAGQVLSPGAGLAAGLRGPGQRIAGALRALVEKLEQAESGEAA